MPLKKEIVETLKKMAPREQIQCLEALVVGLQEEVSSLKSHLEKEKKRREDVLMVFREVMGKELPT